MEIPDPLTEKKPVAGVDLGINRMAQVSDGVYFENPRALKRALIKLKHLQRVVSRHQKGSANRQKAVKQLAKAQFRVSNIRKDALHQATTLLAKTKSATMLENLNVSGMMKNHHLAQAIADVGMHEFRRQLQYKGAWYGCEVFLAPRFFPSTKRCSRCGNEKELSLAERVYSCEACGQSMDRDLNAAINLEQLFCQRNRPFPQLGATASSAERYACGEHIRPDTRQRLLKQEPNIYLPMSRSE
jgi:putative transposase